MRFELDGWCGFFETIQFFVFNIKIKLKTETQHIFSNVLNFIKYYNFIFILQFFNNIDQVKSMDKT